MAENIQGKKNTTSTDEKAGPRTSPTNDRPSSSIEEEMTFGATATTNDSHDSSLHHNLMEKFEELKQQVYLVFQDHTSELRARDEQIALLMELDSDLNVQGILSVMSDDDLGGEVRERRQQRGNGTISDVVKQDLQEENERLREEIRQIREQERRLQEEKEAALEEKNRREESLQELQSRCEKIIEQSNNEKHVLESNCRDLSKKLAEIQEELNASTNARTNVIGLMNKMKENIRKKDEKIKEYEKQTRKMIEEKEHLRTEYEESVIEGRDLKEQGEETESMLKQVERDLNEKDKEIQRIEKQAREIVEEKEHFRGEYAKLVIENSELKEQMREKDEVIQNHVKQQQTASEMFEENQKLKNENEELVTENTALKGREQDLLNKIAANAAQPSGHERPNQSLQWEKFECKGAEEFKYDKGDEHFYGKKVENILMVLT